MKYTIRMTSHFRKDYKLMQKRGLNMSRLDAVIAMLASGKVLDEAYHDHALGGDYAGHRECHIAPDWLLIYYKEKRHPCAYPCKNGHSQRPVLAGNLIVIRPVIGRMSAF